MVLTSRSTTGTNSEDPPSIPSSGGWTQTGLAAAFFHFQLSGVWTPGEGTVPTAHRLAHESPCRPGPRPGVPRIFPAARHFKKALNLQTAR